MNFAFYVSNHGFGHAARNIPLIEKIWRDNKKHQIYVSTDSLRGEMIKHNLAHCDGRITYCGNYEECGVIFKDGCMEVDKEELCRGVEKELQSWDSADDYRNDIRLMRSCERVDSVFMVSTLI